MYVTRFFCVATFSNSWCLHALSWIWFYLMELRSLVPTEIIIPIFYANALYFYHASIIWWHGPSCKKIFYETLMSTFIFYHESNFWMKSNLSSVWYLYLMYSKQFFFIARNSNWHSIYIFSSRRLSLMATKLWYFSSLLKTDFSTCVSNWLTYLNLMITINKRNLRLLIIHRHSV